MDAAQAEATLDQLLAWGLVESRGEELMPTRRWAAKLQVAAEKLNLLAAETGVDPEGNPLVLAVTQALAAENLTEDQPTFARAVQALVALELGRMSAAKRAQLGFADLDLP